MHHYENKAEMKQNYKTNHGYPKESLYQSSKKIYCTKEPLN